jgi:predicted nucleic acid-binding protein
MTSWVVADAGIFLAAVLEESYSKQASALIKLWNTEDRQIAAPTLFRYEIIAVIRKNVFRVLLAPEDALEKRDILLSLAQKLRFFVDDDLLRRSYELATQLNRPTAYDSQYLAVAERLDCEFWTADQKLFNTVTGTLSRVKWVGSYPLPTITS